MKLYVPVLYLYSLPHGGTNKTFFLLHSLCYTNMHYWLLTWWCCLSLAVYIIWYRGDLFPPVWSRKAVQINKEDFVCSGRLVRHTIKIHVSLLVISTLRAFCDSYVMRKMRNYKNSTNAVNTSTIKYCERKCSDIFNMKIQ